MAVRRAAIEHPGAGTKIEHRKCACNYEPNASRDWPAAREVGGILQFAVAE